MRVAICFLAPSPSPLVVAGAVAAVCSVLADWGNPPSADLKHTHTSVTRDLDFFHTSVQFWEGGKWGWRVRGRVSL